MSTTTAPAAAPASVFIVTAYRIDHPCEPRDERVIGAFDRRCDAEEAVRNVREAIAEERGKRAALHALIAEWESNAPDGTSTAAREAEVKRLEAIIGVPSWTPWEEQDAWVEEVPLRDHLEALAAWKAWR